MKVPQVLVQVSLPVHTTIGDLTVVALVDLDLLEKMKFLLQCLVRQVELKVELVASKRELRELVLGLAN
ncbi:hypothetical protein TYRP_021503 [Tyrophagus putrescentiae]|nr:hypothetical protein TYRP_021503 [Tyrophagus putrescentiae]